VVWHAEDKPGASPAITSALDLKAKLSTGGPTDGLLGLALHPKFATKKLAFVAYTAPTQEPGFTRELRVSRYKAAADLKTFDAASELLILKVPLPFANHTAGHIAFGPDGMLYIAVGDGGSTGDPGDRAQNLEQLLGKILRIDVDTQSPYAIPADNPLASAGGRKELYAWGFQDPRRFSFDRETGELWVGDVGASAQELNRVDSGGNHGWRRREGSNCFNPTTGCEDAKLTDPVAEYGKSDGTAITAGVVYRGERMPDMAGQLIYADQASGQLWSLAVEDEDADPVALFRSDRHIVSFSERTDGELVALDREQGGVFEVVSGCQIEEPITFDRVYKEALAKDCAPCHTAVVSGGLDLKNANTAYAALIGKKAATEACEGRDRVVPGKPEQSLLYQKVAKVDLCGPAMPMTMPLSDDQIALIRDWIAAGAPR
jgi:glucose/arabinose dehydrogenase